MTQHKARKLDRLYLACSTALLAVAFLGRFLGDASGISVDVRVWLIIGLGIATISVGRAADKAAREEKQPSFKQPTWSLIVGLIALLSFHGLGSYAWIPRFAFDMAEKHLPIALLEIVVVVFTLLAGVAVYFFRCRRLIVYGQLEVLVGIAGAAYVVNQILGKADGNMAIVFTWAAAIYVIVRGLDNWYKGLQRHRPQWNRLFFGKDVPDKLT